MGELKILTLWVIMPMPPFEIKHFEYDDRGFDLVESRFAKASIKNRVLYGGKGRNNQWR